MQTKLNLRKVLALGATLAAALVLTVEENIALPVLMDGRKVNKERMENLLKILKMEKRRTHLPGQLSGGQQQRVAIARALATKPAIVLADEPTGNLDPKNSFEIMKLLEEINQRGTTVLVVTHNREIVNAFKKRVVTMKKGVIVSDEQEGEYLNEN